MPSRTHICNLALLEIAQDPITDIDDISVTAKRCKLVFDDVVDEVCASKFWSKVKKRVELALLPDPPEYEFNFQFQLPADHLNIISINSNLLDQIEFQIEGNKLLINDSSVFIKYIVKQSNPALWGQLLQRAIELRLAAGLAYIITGDRTLASEKYNLYHVYSKMSAALDSNQGSRRKYRATRLTRVR